MECYLEGYAVGIWKNIILGEDGIKLGGEEGA